MSKDEPPVQKFLKLYNSIFKENEGEQRKED